MLLNSLIAITAILLHFRPSKKLNYETEEPNPGVTILRPLRGIDNYLEQCLRSSFEQKYPKFEIIMSVPDEKDLAIPIAQKLIAEYPKVEARLEIGEVDVGMNPKINNLVKGYNGAKYDIIWMYDSNVYMEPHVMDNSVNELLQPKIGLVHHLPRGIHIQSFGSYLESIYMGTAHARMYLVINILAWLFQRCGLDVNCVVGKSMMFRKSDLEKAGEFSTFGNYLAEDNIIASSILSVGLYHKIGSDYASQILGSTSIADYCSRRIRWGRLRLFLVPVATLIEPLTECLYSGITGSLAASFLFGYNFLTIFGFHCMYWLLSDISLYYAISRDSSDCFKFKNSRDIAKNPLNFLFTWILKEFVYIFVYIYSLLGNTVEWRGQKYKLMIGGKIEPAEKSCKKKEALEITKERNTEDSSSNFLSTIIDSNIISKDQ